MNGFEFFELLLPDGRKVASGSLSFCWDERERWERVIEMSDPKRCKQCKQWIFSRTLGSPDTTEWHCRHGFTPTPDCQKMADYNDECKRKYYREHPEELQLQLNFT